MENEVSIVKKIFKKKAWIIIGILVIVGLIVGLNIYRSGQKTGIEVKTSQIRETKMVETVLASGKVTTAEKEMLYSQVSGSVKKIHVKLGQEVKAGQLLMELDIPDAGPKLLQAQASLAEAEARLIKARAGGKSSEVIEAEASFNRAKSDYVLAKEKLRRNETLFGQGAISKAELETVQADYNNREAEYRRAEAMLNSNQAGAVYSLKALESSVAAARSSMAVAEKQAAQSGLSATIDGRVMSIAVQNGDMLSPNTALITIGNLNSLRVKADIAEADAAKLKLGQKVIISSNAIPDLEYPGQVQEIGLEAVTKTKNQGETTAIPVVVSIQNNSLLRPGFNVDLKITTATIQKAVVVSFDAIVEKQGHSCVYVVRGDKVHLQKVLTGISSASAIQVKSGLKKGDKVVLNPTQGLKDGSEVKVK